MKPLILAVLCLALLTSACDQNGAGAYDENSNITLQKTDCFGTCPVYTIQIDGSGQAKLEGQKFFDKIGTYQKQLSKEETHQLFTAFANADFWSFKDEYTAPVTDMPTTYVTFENHGKRKKITDYFEAPQKLKDLEALVEAIAGSGNWDKLSSKTSADPDPYDQIRRGEYLVNVTGCHDCHSPKKFTDQGPVPDETKLLSGHPADMKVGNYNPEVLKIGYYLTLTIRPPLAPGAFPLRQISHPTRRESDCGQKSNSSKPFVRAN